MEQSPSVGTAAIASENDTSTDANARAGLDPDSNAAIAFGNGAPRPLSADQIFAILWEQPEALVELKSLLADLAQQQGSPIQADAITDDMLYSKIAASIELRANITMFLRARGYVTEDTFEAYAADSDDDGLFSSLLNPQLYGQQLLGPQLGTLPNGAFGSARSANGAGTMLMNPARIAARDGRAATPHAVASLPGVLHRPAPYNLLSLRDLYTQLPEQNGQLKRFGSDVFLHRSAFSTSPLATGSRANSADVPSGPDYVVGPGDGLTVDMWGSITQSQTHEVDRDGKLLLPEAGAVQVAGLTLERTQDVVGSALRRQYRDVQVAVTLARLRSIRIYVVGDVQRPGAYDISSLSTPLNALYAAGGPTAVGSLRVLRHYRGRQLVGEIDLYDFLLHGVQSEERLQAGDTLLVPPAGPQITVYGAVKRPAIYELKSETTLAGVLEDAGGATVSAELGQIVIDRIDANRQRETVSLELPAASNADTTRAAVATFIVNDGDRIACSADPALQPARGLHGRPCNAPWADSFSRWNATQRCVAQLPGHAARASRPRRDRPPRAARSAS